jgi:hypothetical protein
MRPIVRVPPDLAERCQEWAHRSVAGYANGDKENSRQYARPGVDRDPDMQFRGKAGECAYALFFGLDPYSAIDWSPRLDHGWDIRHLGLLIDVKASDTPKLMWPRTKRHFLGQTPADIFAFAHRIERSGTFELSGWISVRDFIARHHVAPPPEWLDPTTQFMNKDELRPLSELIDWPIAHLPPFMRTRAIHIGASVYA